MSCAHSPVVVSRSALSCEVSALQLTLRALRPLLSDDQVSEVCNIAAGEVEDMPNFGADVHTEFLLGLAKQGGRVKLLLDIDRILDMKELASA